MRQDVEFKSCGTTIRAHLYMPEGNGPFPIVVMAGGWCYVKELVQPEYAKAFAGAGLAALVFDYRNFGDSHGEPRQHLDPWGQIEDYRNAISFAETLPGIRKDRAFPIAAATCLSSAPPTRACAASSPTFRWLMAI